VLPDRARLHKPKRNTVSPGPIDKWYKCQKQFTNFSEILGNQNRSARIRAATGKDRSKFKEEQRVQQEGRAMERFAYRPFQPGDIYSPHDLSPAEQKKWKKAQAPATDVFDALNLNPLDQYKVRLPM
jgi:small subunit ribosomal protein S18